MVKQNKDEVYIPDEDDLEDEFEKHNVDSEVERGANYDDEGQIKAKTSALKMSPKAMVITISIVAALIIYILFKGNMSLPEFNFGGDNSEDTEENANEENGGSSSIVSDIVADPNNNEGSEGNDTEGEEVSGSEDVTNPEDDLAYLMGELRVAYPDTNITHNEELERIIVDGSYEGEQYFAILNLEGSVLEEGLGQDATVLKGQHASSIASSGVSGSETTVTNNTVVIDKDTYSKSFLGMKDTPFNYSTTEYVEFKVEQVRKIVNYELLPIKGNVPLIYAKDVDSDFELIFPVDIVRYNSMPKTGITLAEIEFKVYEDFRAVSSLRLSDWR